MIGRHCYPTILLVVSLGSAALAAGHELRTSAAARRESCESLRREWSNKLATIYSSVQGDAAREHERRDFASEHGKQVWKYVKTFERADDIECAWQFGLELDANAESPDLEENARRYLEQFPEGAFRPFAARLLAARRMRAGNPEEIDREIALFDQQHPLAVLEQGQLRVLGAYLALDELDVDRAEKLYDAALALPRSEEELEEAKGNKGESWHEWWQEERERLGVYRRSFAELGGVDLDGKAFRIGDYRGKVLMLEFWASW